MKKIYLFLIICLLICTMGSCKGNKRELTLVCNGEEEVIVIEEPAVVEQPVRKAPAKNTKKGSGKKQGNLKTK